MDMDKLKQWLDIAKNMNGGDFWNNIFDQEFAKQFANEQTVKSSNMDGLSDHEDRKREFPVIDLLEGEDEVVVVMELPGVMKENIELGLKGNNLTIKGTVNPIQSKLNISYSERFYGEFQREITLPDTVNSQQLNAKFWNGLLCVSYQRTIEKGETIQIE